LPTLSRPVGSDYSGRKQADWLSLFPVGKKYGSVKIGRSLNLDRRLSNFVADLPYRVEIVGFIRSINYESIELAFHKQFRYKRLGEEWFDLIPEEILHLRQRKFSKEIVELILND